MGNFWAACLVTSCVLSHFCIASSPNKRILRKADATASILLSYIHPQIAIPAFSGIAGLKHSKLKVDLTKKGSSLRSRVGTIKIGSFSTRTKPWTKLLNLSHEGLAHALKKLDLTLGSRVTVHVSDSFDQFSTQFEIGTNEKTGLSFVVFGTPNEVFLVAGEPRNRKGNTKEADIEVESDQAQQGPKINFFEKYETNDTSRMLFSWLTMNSGQSFFMRDILFDASEEKVFRVYANGSETTYTDRKYSVLLFEIPLRADFMEGDEDFLELRAVRFEEFKRAFDTVSEEFTAREGTPPKEFWFEVWHTPKKTPLGEEEKSGSYSYAHYSATSYLNYEEDFLLIVNGSGSQVNLLSAAH